MRGRTSRRARGAAIAVAAGLGASAVALPSARAGAGEALVSVGAGGGVSLDGSPRGVAGGSVDGWIGLGPLPWLALSVAGGGLPAEGRPSAALLAGGALALDVFRWVPWLEAQGGVALDEAGLAPAARLGLGVDHVLDYTWSIGGFARLDLGPRSSGGARLTGGLRVSFRLEL